MNALAAIPQEVRVAIAFALGTVLGSLANWATYRWAWQRRAISPWSPPMAKALPRQWFDRLPIVGWWGLRRETKLHGRGFWLRPMSVEFGLGVGLAMLYHWEVVRNGLFGLPPGMGIEPSVFHCQFAVHTVFIWLLLVASLIDLDEKYIPDAITIAGAIVGLLFCGLLPQSLLPNVFVVAANPPAQPQFQYEPLQLASPNAFPQFAWTWMGLLIGLGCYWLWCFARWHRPWHARHGIRRAWQVVTARMWREATHAQSLVLLIVGSAAIVGTWFLAGFSWMGLLSGLVGLAVSGGLVWAVRIIGKFVMKREAMGFGDVLLMMMVGTFLGWQPCLLVFFLAPLFGIFAGLAQVILRRDQEIPYGPFLALASVLVVVRWDVVWPAVQDYFSVPWLIPSIVLGGLAAMAIIWPPVHWIVGKLAPQEKL